MCNWCAAGVAEHLVCGVVAGYRLVNRSGRHAKAVTRGLERRLVEKVTPVGIDEKSFG